MKTFIINRLAVISVLAAGTFLGSVAVAATCDLSSNSCYQDGTQSVSNFYSTKFVNNDTDANTQWGYIDSNGATSANNADRVGVSVKYYSPNQDIITPSSGNARLVSADRNPLTDLTISLFNGPPAPNSPQAHYSRATGSYYFHDIYLNLQDVSDTQAKVTTSAGEYTYDIADADGQGKSYFYINTGTTDYIMSVQLIGSFSTLGGFDQLKQVYFSGPVVAASTVPPSEVPVPAAIWLFGSALVGMVGISRRRPLAERTA